MAAEAYRAGFGRPAAFVRSGGTIPAVGLFQDEFGIPTVMMGFANPDDGAHGPNERFELANLRRGIATCIAFYERIPAALGRRPPPSQARERVGSRASRPARMAFSASSGRPSFS